MKANFCRNVLGEEGQLGDLEKDGSLTLELYKYKDFDLVTRG
jgi:hypothetical protein